jgi:hypothetical protein
MRGASASLSPGRGPSLGQVLAFLGAVWPSPGKRGKERRTASIRLKALQETVAALTAPAGWTGEWAPARIASSRRLRPTAASPPLVA